MANRLVQWSAALPDVWHGDASVTLAQWLARLRLAVAAISFAAGAGVGRCTAPWRALGHMPEDLVNGAPRPGKSVTPRSRPVRSSVPRLG